jgi:hypothetical protein
VTTLGEAKAVHAGGVAAVAVYAGAVRVWPTIPDVDSTAIWDLGALQIGADNWDSPASGSVVVDVPTGGPQDQTPVAVLVGLHPVSLSRVFPGGLTRAQATALWAGNRVRFIWASIQSAPTFTQITVLGPTP